MNRNSQLFNAAIQAVRAVESETGSIIEIVIHAAGPENADWIFDEFIQNDVTGFDIMGISYYWAWHKPATITKTGAIIESLRAKHPDYDVMIVETGYLWTTDAQDNANNIINEVHHDYSPASPDAQRRWLVDLTTAVKTAGGLGVIYWEPAWVSTNCFTQWGQGSHQEHATFFDFNHNLIQEGGIAWLPTNTPTNAKELNLAHPIRIFTDSSHRILNLEWPEALNTDRVQISLISSAGKLMLSKMVIPALLSPGYQLQLPELAAGIYFVVVRQGEGLVAREKIWIGGR